MLPRRDSPLRSPSQTKAIAAQKAAMDKMIADKKRLATAVAALKAEEARVTATVNALLKGQFGSGLPTVYKGGWTWPVLHNGSGFVKPIKRLSTIHLTKVRLRELEDLPERTRVLRRIRTCTMVWISQLHLVRHSMRPRVGR